MATASLRVTGGGQAAEVASETATGESDSRRRHRPADSDPCGVILLNWEPGTSEGSTLRDAPAPTTSCGTRAAPTDRGGNWERSPYLRAHHPWIRQAAREEVPAPLPLHVPPPAWQRRVASPGFPPPSSPAPGHTHREDRLQAQRQRAEPEPERRAPHASQTGGGSSAGCADRSCGLRGAAGPLY